ncbi:MAG: TadE family type IV pilus minor pilin [Jiangellaceae bacterium]
MTTISRRRGSPRRRRSHDDPARGAVTAEIAAALPALVVIVVGAVWLVAVALAQIQCVDAAREAARAAARGEQPAVVSDLAETVAPDRASVQVRIGEDTVTVDVSARIPVPLPFGADLPAPTVHARAAAVLERP